MRPPPEAAAVAGDKFIIFNKRFAIETPAHIF